MSKLLLAILYGLKKEKRVVLASDINKDVKMWEKDDKLEDYQQEINKTFIDSIVHGAKVGADIGATLGSVFGKIGEATGKIAGRLIGGVCSAISSFLSF